MLIKDQISIGHKVDTELFNGLGFIEGIEGRLIVVLDIQPIPELHWEFELLNNNDLSYFWKISDQQNENLLFSLGTLEIRIVEPYISCIRGTSKQIVGSAKEVFFNDPDIKVDCFECYITNTDFLRTAFGISSGSKILSKREFEEWLSLFNDELNSFYIDHFWELSLCTSLESLEWLKPASKNRGSIITAKFSLLNQDLSSCSDSSKVKALSEAKKIFSNLCLMLSYANGGHISPCYIVAKNKLQDSLDEIYASVAIASINSPQEDIGEGFMRNYGIKDLAKYIKCFPQFESMLSSNHWRGKWILILEWYFQVIPRLGGRKKNSIVTSVKREHEGNAREVLMSLNANVLGSLLENLSYLLLV